MELGTIITLIDKQVVREDGTATIVLGLCEQ